MFNCLASKAVHVKVVNTMDKDSFIQAIWKFIARRGTEKVLRSYNGTSEGSN